MNSEYVSFIRQYYLSSTKPVKNIFSKFLHNRENIFDEKTQMLILKSTVFHPKAIKYPNKNYARQFLKTFISLIGDKNFEVCEELYQIYTELLSLPLPEDELLYRTYLLGNNTSITLRESNSFIAENTTGLHTWEAGKKLAEWCYGNKNIFYEKCILELGCGVGFSGMSICITCKPQKYIYTDCSDRVLELLKENLVLNKDSIVNVTEVNKLIWGENLINIKDDIDYTVAADVIYDPNDHEVLCSTIKDIKPKFGTILSTKERNPESRERFEKCLVNAGLHFTKLEHSKENLFIYPDEDIFYIYKITC